MKKLLFILSYSLYFFFVFGLIFHTSSTPEILGKYTVKYAVLLLFLILFFPVFLFLLYFLQKKTIITLKKKKYSIRYFQKTLIILIFLFIFILLPFEVIFREKYKNFESNIYRYTIYNFHPFLQAQQSNKNDYGNISVNSDGFRGKEITVKKQKDTYRIFVLGGSTVLNSGVSYEKTFEKILEDKLQKTYPNKKIEVLNAGNDGYTTEHSLIQYLFKIKDFNPDLIITWHGINDWYYSCNPKTYSHTSYKPDYSHFLGAASAMVFNHFKQPPIFQIHLVSLDFFIQFLKDNLYSDLFEKIKEINKFRGIYVNNSNIYEMNEFQSLGSYKRNLQSMINILKSDNVKLILGNQPFLYRKGLDTETQKKLIFPAINCIRNDGKYPSLNSMITAINTYNDATKSIARENDVMLVDLEKSLPKNLLYFTDDVHYTAKGNHTIAEVLYKFIISNNVLLEN